MKVNFGAGEGNRTPVLSLEGYSNNHYTTPAFPKGILTKYFPYFNVIFEKPANLLCKINSY